MKIISTEMQDHLDGETLTLCTCWKLTLTDGSVMGFTDHTQDLIIDGVTYVSSAGYTPSVISVSSDLSNTNLDITGLLVTEYVNRADIRSGKYDSAKIEVFFINYMDITMGIIPLKKGWISDIEMRNDKYIADLISLTDMLSSSELCEAISPQCRAILGDARCGINVSTYTVTGSVSSVTNSVTLLATGLNSFTNDYFTYGEITFTSGANLGLSQEIKKWTQSGQVIKLFVPFPNIIAVSDTFNIYPGCDRSYLTCHNKFDNIINFRGEPFLPGSGELLKYANKATTQEITT